MFKAMNSNMARAQRYTCSSPSHTNTALVLQVESIVVVIGDQSIHHCLHIGAGASAP